MILLRSSENLAGFKTRPLDLCMHSIMHVKHKYMKLSSFVSHFPGWSPLHEAACKGYLDVCKMLIKSGAEVNVHGYCDETPLHDAAFNNHPKV
jgi:ankyrin repeat protein